MAHNGTLARLLRKAKNKPFLCNFFLKRKEPIWLNPLIFPNPLVELKRWLIVKEKIESWRHLVTWSCSTGKGPCCTSSWSSCCCWLTAFWFLCCSISRDLLSSEGENLEREERERRKFDGRENVKFKRAQGAPK